MHALGIQSLLIRHCKQRQQDVTTNLRGAGSSCHTKAVAATGDFNIEAAFNLPQVFIKLTAEIGQAIVIGGLENQVPRNLISVQST